MIVKYPTMDKLWTGSIRRMLLAPTAELNHWHGATTIINSNFLTADSMQYSFDAGRDLWLTRSRFTKLQRDYLYGEEVEAFLARTAKIHSLNRGVVTQLVCRNHGVREHPTQDTYQWGNCLLAFTFRGGKKNKPTIGMHSRVSYVSYMGGFDLALAYVLGKEVAAATGIELEDIGFEWYSDVLQLHAMKSIPFYHAREFVEEYIDNTSISHADKPSLRLARSCLSRLRRKHEEGPTWDTEKHGPLKHLRQRYEYYIDTGESKMPSCPVDTLTLDGIMNT